MPGLNLDTAPETATPVRFLRWVPAWSVSAACLVAMLDPSAWNSRWHPGVLAIVHALMLGVLGNACLGALVQFLGAAAGAPVAGGPSAWRAWSLLYNVGTMLLVAGFWRLHDRTLLITGALVLMLALGGALVAMFRGLRRGGGDTGQRRALVVPLASWCVTAMLGAMLVAGLSGRITIDLPAWTDAHATFGLLGSYGGLLVVVSRTVAPMLLGTVRPRPRWRWPLVGAATLAMIVATRLVGAPTFAWKSALMLLLATMVAAATWLLRRPWQSQRNRPLWLAWMLALATGITAGGIGLAGGGDDPSLRFATTAALVGGALPLAVVAMAIEINVFLAWISGHRSHPLAHLPNVHVLLPDRGKWLWLGLQATSVPAISVLALHPGTPTRFATALAMGASGLVLAWLLHSPWAAMRRWREA